MWDVGDPSSDPSLDPALAAHIASGGAWMPPTDVSPAPAPTPIGPAQLHPDIVQGVTSGWAPQQPAPIQMPASLGQATLPQPAPNVPSVPDQAVHMPSAADHALVAKHEAERAQLDAKHQAEIAKYVASPEGQQEVATKGQMDADKERAQNALDLGASQKQQAEAEAALRQKQIDDTQAQQDKHANVVAEQQRQALELHNQYAQAVDAAAKKTVDPNRAWSEKSTGGKIASIFAILLSGVGQGLSGGKGPNLALDQINKAIDQDIDAQKANIDQGNKVVGMRHDVETDYGHLTDDVNAQWTMRQAEGRVKAADQLLQQASQFKGTAQYAQAVDTAAQLKGEASAKLGALATQRVTQAHQKKELAIQQQNANTAGGHLALASRAQKFNEAMQTRQQDTAEKQFDQNLAERYLTANNSGDTAKAAAIKEQREHGLYDPATGSPILSADGEKVMAHADQLELAARTAKTPEIAQALKTQAQGLRESAQTEYGVKSENAKEIKPKMAQAQNLVDGISGILEELDKDPSSFDRAKMAELGTMFERAKMADIQFLGSKVSSREMKAMEELTGEGFDNLASRTMGRGKIKAHLEAMMKGVQSDTDAMLRSEGALGPSASYHLKPQRGTPAETLTGKTGTEVADDATPGAITSSKSLLADALHPIDTIRGNGKFGNEQTSAEESYRTGPTGLAPEDTAKVTSMLGRYDRATDAERAKILTTLTSFASSDRTGIANGTLGLIRAGNPEVFKQILPQLSPEMQQTYGGPGPVDPREALMKPNRGTR